MMEYFYLEDYQPALIGNGATESDLIFEELCIELKRNFEEQWRNSTKQSETAKFLKSCLIGEEVPVNTLKSQIEEYIRVKQLANCRYPSWYPTLVDAIYHENWGLAGLAEFYTPKYVHSSSAKVIGERIYFLVSGSMVLQPQRLTKNRREQLVRAMLINTPEERLDKDYHEIYMVDGSRIEIYNEKMTKRGQDVIVIRRYIIPEYSFEEQSARGTIPEEAIPLLKAMVRMGPNVAFTGAVRTAKTTMLSTWQRYEDPRLEGVMVETDPEIPLHEIMPTAPIIQIVVNDDQLKDIVKPIMRSDADYIVMAEARNGLALHIAVSIANKGTKKVKITYHTREAEYFCYDVGAEISSYTGQSMDLTIKKVARSFDFIFHMIQLPDKSQKRLEGIYQVSNLAEIQPICKYNHQMNTWEWFPFTKDGREQGFKNEDVDAYQTFEKLLNQLVNERKRKDGENRTD